MGKLREIHTHPGLESELGLSKEHVIVDRHVFEKLKQLEQSDPVIVAVREILTCVHFCHTSEEFQLLEQDIINKWLKA